jgi:class 3 adenylate cyclase
MVFADLADFSRLTDAQIPAFLDFFANVTATAAVTMPVDAKVRACGDEIFAVMENAFDVLKYALALNRTLAESAFCDDQSQRPMRARIALHAGQIVLAADPVTGFPSHYGRNVNLAARLERVTEPGHVFATSDFIDRLKQEQALPCAKLVSNAPGWTTSYLGTLCLPKNFGFQEVYEIRESGCRS